MMQPRMKNTANMRTVLKSSLIFLLATEKEVVKEHSDDEYDVSIRFSHPIPPIMQRR